MTPMSPTTQIFIHPNCPHRLKSAIKHTDGNMRKLAADLGVNIYYVSRAIRHGERPANANIAKALFFPREYTRRIRSDKHQEQPRHIHWWRHELTRENRNAWILQAWTQTHLGENP